MKTTTTVTVCKCDRCGYIKDEEKEHTDGVSGEMTIKYDGHLGGRTWQGDWGGSSHKGEAWICHKCTRDFLDFLVGNMGHGR